jgi:acyl-coenzyme A thioesterase PaaI-like protein
MKHKVKKKQQNSRMCLVCGLKNTLGLKAQFYELENKEVVSIFTPREEHQGYPDRLHGGISSSILDETIGRAIMIKYKEDYWGVTVEFSIRFKKPIPLNEELKVVGRITEEKNRFFEGTGEILLKNGDVAATGKGKYIKVPLEKIVSDIELEDELEWKVTLSEKDPEEIEMNH